MLQARLDPHCPTDQQRDARHSAQVAGKRGRVWRYLTESDLRQQGLAAGAMTLRAGAPWGNGDVTFALKEKGDRVLLTVTHRGIDDGTGQRAIAPGWHMHLENLVALASGAEAPTFWSGWTELQGTYD
jgi:uncharacterized protein YndB with AHSA1/START domain